MLAEVPLQLRGVRAARDVGRVHRTNALSPRTQLLLEIEQGLLAHADEAFTRPVDIDDDRQYQRDRYRHQAYREGLPES